MRKNKRFVGWMRKNKMKNKKKKTKTFKDAFEKYFVK